MSENVRIPALKSKEEAASSGRSFCTISTDGFRYSIITYNAVVLTDEKRGSLAVTPEIKKPKRVCNVIIITKIVRHTL